LPPIHPIGITHRKGPNNTLTPGPNDPGSPWAVGGKDGGHDAIHPDLGTEKDFVEFVKAANKLNIEVALDLALQASPDHPWVKSNPKWFTQRADGSIAYAENPPKKYQDIYPINFDLDPTGIYAEVERVVRHWMNLGVRIFRVDNPHTKPVAFWEWLIARINATDPDVIFLAEAFTRPAMMRALAEVGFQQSYTYFTWRNSKWELEEYLNELSGGASSYMRPNFFVNTPDILPTYLQNGGRPAFAIRAALGATMSPTWGVYAGYELFENQPTKPGAEEYYFSEKYEYKNRDWDGALASGNSLAPFIGQLNKARRAHRALQQLRNITFHRVDSDQVICYSKRDGDDLVIVIVTLDPFVSQATAIHFDMPALGFGWQDHIQMIDELSGDTYTLSEHSAFQLDPSANCAIILSKKNSR
jgi:starch synthase (maltosyl-transferring)